VTIFSFVLEANVLTCHYFHNVLEYEIGNDAELWQIMNYARKLIFSCPMVSLFFYSVLWSNIEMAGLGGTPIPSAAIVSHCPLSPHVCFFSIFYAWLNVN
jgi:hypothetical protein